MKMFYIASVITCFSMPTFANESIDCYGGSQEGQYLQMCKNLNNMTTSMFDIEINPLVTKGSGENAVGVCKQLNAVGFMQEDAYYDMVCKDEMAAVKTHTQTAILFSADTDEISELSDLNETHNIVIPHGSGNYITWQYFVSIEQEYDTFPDSWSKVKIVGDVDPVFADPKKHDTVFIVSSVGSELFNTLIENGYTPVDLYDKDINDRPDFDGNGSLYECENTVWQDNIFFDEKVKMCEVDTLFVYPIEYQKNNKPLAKAFNSYFR